MAGSAAGRSVVYEFKKFRTGHARGRQFIQNARFDFRTWQPNERDRRKYFCQRLPGRR